MSVSRRLTLLTVAAAVWGLAAGVSIATLWIAEPHAGQLPGAMLLYRLDARAPLRMIVTAMLSPLVAAIMLQPLVRRLATDPAARAWATNGVAIALLGGLWLALADPYDAVVVIFAPLLASGALLLLRHFDARFTRRDVILVPAALTLFASLTMIASALPVSIALVLAVFCTLAVRLAIEAMRPPTGATAAFTISPLACILLVRQWFGAGMAMPLLAAAGAIALPFVLARRLRQVPERLLRLVVYPIFAIALVAAIDQQSMEGLPRLNFFEDGHSLLPANEMMYGARPYRDVVPGHGLISDGVLDWIAMRLGAREAGDVLRVRAAVSLLAPAAVYAVALAATGSPAAAILALLVATSVVLAGTPWSVPVTAVGALPPIRPLPSLVSLAACCVALRRNESKWLTIAGELAMLAFFTSIEFGVYAFVALGITVLRMRTRSAAVRAFVGAAVVAVLASLIFVALGCFGAFIHVHRFEIPPLSEAYAIALFHFPPAYASMLGVPEILAAFFAARTVWIAAWCVVAIATATAIVLPRRSRIIDPLVACGAWVVASGLSFGERTNVYFMPVALIIAVAAVRGLRLRRAAFLAGAIAIAVVAAPAQQIERFASLLRTNSAPPRGFVRYEGLPRARGVWVELDNAERLAAAQRFIDGNLRRDEIFFDFACQPILYYLFDRRCPIRQYETPFYETEALQREVIARLERNHTVRAVLMQFPNQGALWIDGVPNSIRAPLVFDYLRAHFAPAYADRGVVFWMRKLP